MLKTIHFTTEADFCNHFLQKLSQSYNGHIYVRIAKYVKGRILQKRTINFEPLYLISTFFFPIISRLHVE